MYTKKLNVLYTCDDLYAPFAGVSIHSLLTSNSDIEEIDIYVICDRVSDTNKNKLCEEVSSFGDTRHLILIDGAPLVEKLKELNVPCYRNSYAANFRLFMQSIVKPDAETLLYLDCDTLVVSSLKDLLELDFQGKPAAVAKESIVGEYKKHIGFEDKDSYLNSGVIFFHIENWAKHQCSEKLLSMLKSASKIYLNPDQDYLNLILKDNSIILSPRYNLQPSHMVFSTKSYFRNYPSSHYYSEQEISASVKNPVILHTYRFCGQFPWHKNSIHPQVKLWRKNLLESKFKDLEPLESRGAEFVLERFLYRILPKSWFLAGFARFQRYHNSRTMKKNNKK